MSDRIQLGLGWTVVLRRQPARMVAGRPEGGYTDAYELVCCDCGDDPDLDYREVQPELQRVRGPYPIAGGIAAYGEHVRQHQSVPPRPGRVMRRHGRRRDAAVKTAESGTDERDETWRSGQCS
jgi:hypothetical protein